MNGMDTFTRWLNNWLSDHLHLSGTQLMYAKIPVLLLGIFIVCVIAWWIIKRVIISTVYKIFLRTKITWDDILVKRRVFDKLAAIVPALIISSSSSYIFEDFPVVARYVAALSDIFIIGVITWVIISLLTVTDDVLSNTDALKEKPISSYIQVIKIFVYFISGILILSALLGKSPLYFLTAMGAMTAVLILIFKDTILGFVASIEISVYDMIRVGDWIEMPDYNADGDVISINLNTVKVQNWDKTITTIPTYAFISDSFKNWRGMSESGGRRIKRAIYLKMSSFKFCDESMINRFKQYRLLRSYIADKEQEIEIHNRQLKNDSAVKVNVRRLTNIGIFRIYATKYLEENERINHGMTCMVRQLAPTSKGLPLEIYCFSADQRWVYYEGIMADIFDHLITVASEFDLEIFEEPTGKDWLGRSGHKEN